MDTATPRNASCPCGSGKRYKHCHGVAAGADDPSLLLAQALSEQRAGRLEAAESLYRRVLEETPGNPDAMHMRFHQLNTYAIAARATELVELELGRPLRWGFEGSRLLVVPHATGRRR